MREFVLDVSKHDRGIDLAAWKDKFNLWGVIIKFGGNERVLGGQYKDSAAEEHYIAAKRLGLHVGAYYYTDSVSIGAIISDVDHFVSLLSGHEFDLPCYVDVEDARQFELSRRTLTDLVREFCDRMKAYGYYPGMYTGGYAFIDHMYTEELRDYSIWIAWWGDSWPQRVGKIAMWQFGGKRLSDGHVVYDDVPGYVDANYCAVDYPSIIASADSSVQSEEVTMSKINPADIAAKIHYDMVMDERNGYSQAPRWGGDHPDGVKHLTIDGLDYEYKLGSYDCSSSCITAWKQALKYTKYKGVLDNATYTGDMRSVFVASGLFTARLTAAKRGDLYLNEGKHVAMCQDGGSDSVFGYDCLTEFNRNENHAATGGKVGDQDKQESIFRTYYNDNWNTVLHYVGGLIESTVKITVTTPIPTVSNTAKGEPIMACFVKLDGDQTEHFFDGTTFHALRYSHEKDAIVQLYKKMGYNLNIAPIEIGSVDSPFGARLVDAFGRGPAFKTMNAFEKHENLDNKVDILGEMLAKLFNKIDSLEKKIDGLDKVNG